jgi:hypothetical protein
VSWLAGITHNPLYTAILIITAGLKLQAFESRQNGAMGINWNLHISIEQIYIQVCILACGVFVFLSVKPFL